MFLALLIWKDHSMVTYLDAPFQVFSSLSTGFLLHVGARANVTFFKKIFIFRLF